MNYTENDNKTCLSATRAHVATFTEALEHYSYFKYLHQYEYTTWLIFHSPLIFLHLSPGRAAEATIYLPHAQLSAVYPQLSALLSPPLCSRSRRRTNRAPAAQGRTRRGGRAAAEPERPRPPQPRGSPPSPHSPCSPSALAVPCPSMAATSRLPRRGARRRGMRK